MAVSITQTANPAGVASSSNIATYTGVSIGTASADRLVVVCVATELVDSAPTACTIDYGGGDTAMSTATATATFVNQNAKIYYLKVTTGTTATVKVTFGATNPDETQNHIAVYSVKGASLSANGTDTSDDMDSTDPLTSGAITVPTLGGFIGVVSCQNDTNAKTWSGATEDIDDDAGAFRFSTAISTTEGATTVTCTGVTDSENGALAWVTFSGTFPIGWSYYHKLSVQGALVKENSVNFPIPLKSSNFLATIWANTINGGHDVRFSLNTSGTSQLPFEVVSWNTVTQSCEVHVKYPSLATASNSDFYVFFGKSTATSLPKNDTYGANNVWDSNTKAVWHLSAGANATQIDSTVNNNHMQPGGSFPALATIPASLSDSVMDFGTNNVLLVPGVSQTGIGLATTSFTVESYIFPDAVTGGQKDIITSEYAFYAMALAVSTTKTYGITNNDAWFTGATIGAGAWSHAYMRYNSATTVMAMGVNGGAEVTGNDNRVGGDDGGNIALAGSATVYLGKRFASYDGKMDEVRIHDTVRSQAWMQNTYLSLATPQLFTLGSGLADFVYSPEVTSFPTGAMSTNTKFWGN